MSEKILPADPALSVRLAIPGSEAMGVAVRALCRVLDYVGVDYDLRSFDDIRRLRGF